MRSDPQRPIATNAAKSLIHRFAEEVAKHVGLNPGDPLQSVVERLGGRISYHSPFVPQGSAPPSIEVESPHKFVIHIPSTTSPQRDRFTIAHELGHLFLHYPMVQKEHPGQPMIATRWVDQSDFSQQRAEWEANWFAAGFLMPEAEFRDAFRAHGDRLVPVATLFDVSEQAANVRAKSLGLK
jgi:predicted transcriptional regulator